MSTWRSPEASAFIRRDSSASGLAVFIVEIHRVSAPAASAENRAIKANRDCAAMSAAARALSLIIASLIASRPADSLRAAVSTSATERAPSASLSRSSGFRSLPTARPGESSPIATIVLPFSPMSRSAVLKLAKVEANCGRYALAWSISSLNLSSWLAKSAWAVRPSGELPS